MIKDIFKLKKNAWHTKLLKFFWNIDYYDFSNMCPYFWLTVATVIISPILAPFWLTFKAVRYVSASYSVYCERKEKEFADEKRRRIINLLNGGKEDDGFLDKLSEAWSSGFASRRKKQRKVANIIYDEMENVRRSWIGILDDKERQSAMDKGNNKADKLEGLLLERRRVLSEKKGELSLKAMEKQRLYEEVQAKKKARRKERIASFRKFLGLPESKLTKRQLIGLWTARIKKAFKVIAYIAVAFVLYLLFKLTVWMTTLNWSGIWDASAPVILWIFIGACSLIILGGLIYLGWTSIKKCAPYCMPCDERKEKLIRFFTNAGNIMYYVILPLIWVIKGLAWIGLKIWSVIKFIAEVIMAFKKDNCPAIDWKD